MYFYGSPKQNLLTVLCNRVMFLSVSHKGKLMGRISNGQGQTILSLYFCTFKNDQFRDLFDRNAKCPQVCPFLSFCLSDISYWELYHLRVESISKYKKHYSKIFYRFLTDSCNIFLSVVQERFQEWAPKDLRFCLCNHRGATLSKSFNSSELVSSPAK